MKLNIELLQNAAYAKRLDWVHLAQKTSMSPHCCSRIMRDKGKTYSKDRLIRICEALDLSYDEIFIKPKQIQNSGSNNINRIHILYKLVKKLDNIEKVINQLN